MKNKIIKAIDCVNNVMYKSLILDYISVILTMYGSYKMYMKGNMPAFYWTIVALLVWGICIFTRYNCLSLERKIKNLVKEKTNNK